MATSHMLPFNKDIAVRTALFEPMKRLGQSTTLAHFRAPLDIINKDESDGGYDPVTEADRACEAALRALIEEHFPQDGIFGEEYGTVRLDAEFIWVIDPIDGTRGFVAGVPLWGMLVGLMQHRNPVAGLGYQPYLDEAFWTQSPVIACMAKARDKREIKTRKGLSIDQATLFTTTPALFDTTERAAYDALEGVVRNIRYGTDWYGYALIAAGTADIVVESGLSPYDILPLVPIIEAAGGAVVDWSGAPLPPLGNPGKLQVLAVADRALIEPVSAILRSAAR